MVINGLQKLTLLDYPEKVACTIFTSGCNFRCPFCHNAPLVLTPDKDRRISEDEILAFLKKRIGMLDGVCITGGEPLLNHDIGEFIKKIKSLGFAVKLDTNGSFPKRLKELIDNRLLDYVAMDIKNCKELYGKTVDIGKFDISDICKSVEILKYGKIDYEFRTTVVRELHNTDCFLKIGEWLKGDSKYFLQQYIASDNLIGEPMTSYTKEEMAEFKKAISCLLPKTALRGV